MSRSEMGNGPDLFKRTCEMLDRGGLGKRDADEVARKIASDPSRLGDYLRAVELHALLESQHGALTALATSEPSTAAAIATDSTTSESHAASCSDDVCGAEIAELIGLFDEAAAAIDRADGLAARAGRFTGRWLLGAAVAASLAVSLWLAQSGLNRVGSQDPIGVLTNASGARWDGSNDNRLLPEHIVPGQEIGLERGVAELTLTSGVVVVMRGPAKIDVVSPMRVRARHGAVRARVGEAAKGFVLETPTTDVIDLGTEFGVDIDPESGDTDVVVFDGKVNLKYVGRRGPSRGASERRPQPLGLLHTGEGLRVDATGATSRIVSIHSDTYPEIADGVWKAAQTPLIASVSDNLRTPEATQYYQIVHRGFREDARAFVDRHHEWNGDQQDGLPAYLVGGDYVQTFNSDKLEPGLRITVELSAPATLYVLFDRRVEPPAWLSAEFEPTGDLVGVDEEYRGVQKFLFRDIGPGASIDTRHSVWRRRVDLPSKVELGGLPSEEIRSSMYGIVATPLPADPSRLVSDDRVPPLPLGVMASESTADHESTLNSSGVSP